MLAQAVLDRQKDHALRFEMFLDGVIDHLGFVLRPNPGQEFLLGFGDTQFVEGVLDVGGHVVPGLALGLGWLDIVIDLVQVQA
jgi:hypothetical protein